MDYLKRDPVGRDLLFASAVSLRPTTEQLGVPVDKEIRRKIVHQLEREVDLPVHRKDFFYSGSMLRVNEYLSSNNVNEYVRTVTLATEDSGEKNYVLKMLRELFDFGLFTSPTFILLITSSVFGLFGYPVPYVFLKDNAQNLGYSVEDSSNLLVYLCAVNTIGRVLAGRPSKIGIFVLLAMLLDLDHSLMHWDALAEQKNAIHSPSSWVTINNVVSVGTLTTKWLRLLPFR
ncbi:unnamed protein product [Schistocephalus solidus]|uniref:Ubiquitin-like domain-containing protein n=1 Tax=Schistocephalus solidus TaxID=70667 RepID=A0A183TR26_SCHSO|nr:unnamed protein product [Schistocephalus solidus]